MFLNLVKYRPRRDRDSTGPEGRPSVNYRMRRLRRAWGSGRDYLRPRVGGPAALSRLELSGPGVEAARKQPAGAPGRGASGPGVASPGRWVQGESRGIMARGVQARGTEMVKSL